MARPVKIGLDYYNTDTDRYQDIRIKRLKKEFGCDGVAVYDYVLCEIYRVKGCFIEWDENTLFDVSEYWCIEESRIGEIIDYCCKVGLFNSDIRNEKQILTSTSIQKRYKTICTAAKRKSEFLPEEIRLIPEETELPKEETEFKPEESTQRKVKESKGNKSKENLSIKASKSEREIFYEIFFFKNFYNPANEVKRFSSHYEATGWVRSNGSVVVDRVALAETWEQENKQTTRFPAGFLDSWRVLYDDLKLKHPDQAKLLIQELRGVAIDKDYIRLFIETSKISETIEQNLDYYRPFFSKYHKGRKLGYCLDNSKNS